MALNMSTLLNLIFFGIISGSAYALFSVGLSLILGVSGIINIAHGDIYTLGAYFSLLAVRYVWDNPFFGLFTAFILSLLVGVLLDRVPFTILRTRAIGGRELGRRESFLVLTLGISMIISNGLLLIFGARYEEVPEHIVGYLDLSFVSISLQRLLIFAVSIVLLVSLFLFLRRTKTGIAIRAVSEDIDTSRALGIDVERIYTITVALGCGLAGIAGALVSPVFYVSPTAGFPLTLKGLTIIILGGMGNPVGALIGSFILGITESIVVYTLGNWYRTVASLVMMILVLLIRPTGILGKKRERP